MAFDPMLGASQGGAMGALYPACALLLLSHVITREPQESSLLCGLKHVCFIDCCGDLVRVWAGLAFLCPFQLLKPSHTCQLMAVTLAQTASANLHLISRLSMQP